FVALRELAELARGVDIEARDQLLLVRRVDATAEVREILDRLATGELVVERELARQVADTAMDRDRVDGRLDAEDARRSAGRPDRRRLAGTVGTEEAEGLALVDPQVDLDDPAVLAVALGELVGLDDPGHGMSFLVHQSNHSRRMVSS